MATPAMSSNQGSGTMHHVALSAISESKTNPRKHFDKKALHELALSIAEKGVLVPLLVRPAKGFDVDETPSEMRYEIVAGARRYRAAKDAGVEQVPVIVRELDDLQALEVQVIENLQRRDVHPLEEAEGYKQLLAAGKYKDVDALAAKVGKSISYVYQRLKLADMIEPVQKAFFEEKLSAGHAIQIARLKPEQQKKVLTWFKHNDLSVRELASQIDDEFHLDLAQAIFPTDNAEMFQHAGACGPCRKRTGANPSLFDDIKKGDTCTDPECFHEKESGFVKIQLGTHPEAVALSLDHHYNEAVKGRDQHQWKPAGAKKCPDTGEGVIVQWDGRVPDWGDKKGLKLGNVLQICINPSKCKVHGSEHSSPGGGSGFTRSPAEKKRDKERRIELRRRALVFNDTATRSPKEPSIEELRYALEWMAESLQHDNAKNLCQAMNWPVKTENGYGNWRGAVEKFVKTVKPNAVAQWIVLLAVAANELWQYPGSTLAKSPMVNEIAKARGVDLAAHKLAANAPKSKSQTSAKPGTCRICGCTEKRACRFMTQGGKVPVSCSWTDASKTLCNNPKCVKAAAKAKAA